MAADEIKETFHMHTNVTKIGCIQVSMLNVPVPYVSKRYLLKDEKITKLLLPSSHFYMYIGPRIYKSQDI